MEETAKIRIVSLEEKYDYSLWRIRVRAVISAWKLNVLFGYSVDEDDEKVLKKMEEASNVLFSSLLDHTLHVVRWVISDRAYMVVKLDN